VIGRVGESFMEDVVIFKLAVVVTGLLFDVVNSIGIVFVVSDSVVI